MHRQKENAIDQEYLTYRINRASEAENAMKAKEEKNLPFTSTAENQKETDLLYRLDYVSRIENSEYRQQEVLENERRQSNQNKIADYRRAQSVAKGREYEQM